MSPLLFENDLPQIADITPREGHTNFVHGLHVRQVNTTDKTKDSALDEKKMGLLLVDMDVTSLPVSGF